MSMCVLNSPKNYGNIIGLIVSENFYVAQSLSREEQYDFIHAFVENGTQLRSLAPDVVRYLAPHGMLWISWPRKSSHVPTDLTEQMLRDVFLPLGVVDVKVCAIDDTWSGLKFVRRLTKPAS